MRIGTSLPTLAFLKDLFLPRQASEIASSVDALMLYWLLITFVFAAGIFAAIFIFAIKYRRRSEAEVPTPVGGSLALEVAWSVIPLILCLVLFGWGTNLYFRLGRDVPGAKEIFVLGKQWMWVIEHPEGKRELNELHVPLGRPIRLTMVSEDVIHSFYVPAFRIKRDVYPGQYSSLSFTATEEGEHHLFCAEYCGAEHSRMIGKVHVMKPVDYERWLSGGSRSESLASRGEKLFNQLGCASCHANVASARGPSLIGLWGKDVPLAAGGVARADRSYVRESILEPTAKIVAGYQPIMPTYRGQVSEEGLLQLLAYIESLKSPRSQ